MDEIIANSTPVVPMPGTSKAPPAVPNLDSSKVLNWFETTSMEVDKGAQNLEQVPTKEQTPTQMQIPIQVRSPIRIEQQASNQDEQARSAPDSASVNDQKMELTTIKNNGAMREEIKVELISSGGAKFTGSLTMQEAKHGIFRDCLGFKDFKNFDGVRFAYRGVQIVAVKLKEAINVLVDMDGVVLSSDLQG